MTPASNQPVPSAGWFSDDRRPLTAMIGTNFLFLFSNQLTAIAVPWFVLTLTGSATRTGFTAAVTLLPSIVMTFFGGALVDRMSARRMSVFSDAMSGVTVALVPLLYMLGVLNFPLLLLLMFLGAVFDSPGGTARSTMLPRLAERAGIPLERVNSIYGVNESLTALFGAAIAGVLVGSLGAINVLWFNALAFAVSAVGMVLFVPELAVASPSGDSLMQDVREGASWLWNKTALRTIVFAAVMINGTFSPLVSVALPYFAKVQFNSATALGVIMSGFGAGSLVGAITYGAFGTRVSRRLQIVVNASLITVPVIGMVALPSLWIACLLQFVTGLGVGAVNPIIGTIIMTITLAQMLGRITGVFRASAMVASPVGVLLGGPLIAYLGLPGAFTVFAVLLMGVLILIVGSQSLHELDVESDGALGKRA